MLFTFTSSHNLLVGSLPCPKTFKCSNNSVCVVDPLFPDKPDCKCNLNFKKSADGKQCEGMLLWKQQSPICINCHWHVRVINNERVKCQQNY